MDKEMLEFQKSALQGTLSEPLCAEYKQEWRKCGDDKLKLITLSLRQQSIPFVASHSYNNTGVTKEYVKEKFAEYINGYTVHDADGVSGYTYGLFVDSKEITADKDVNSLMWCNESEVVIPTSKCPVIYVSNKSDVKIVCEGFNSVRVYLFDESKIVLDDVDEESSVTIYRYSDNAKVEVGKFCLSTKIREFKKMLRL